MSVDAELAFKIENILHITRGKIARTSAFGEHYFSVNSECYSTFTHIYRHNLKEDVKLLRSVDLDGLNRDDLDRLIVNEYLTTIQSEINLIRSINNNNIEYFKKIFLIDTKLFCLSSARYFECMYFVMADENSGINERAISYFINQITHALLYLAGHHIVLRSLMAKTIFVDKNLTVTLTGFSQARQII
ncbi:hypothetical protein MXB_5672 [Myxobolus squamalis]|nr:hypothetical protein MXB_5672 [Myxobolus squamalis]